MEVIIYIYIYKQPLTPSNRDEDIEEGDHEGSLSATEQVSNNGRSYGAVTSLSNANQGPHEDQHPEVLQDIKEKTDVMRREYIIL